MEHMLNILKPDLDRIIAENDFEELVRALRHRSDDVREQAARAVARLKSSDGQLERYKITDRRASQPLAMLLHDPDPVIRLGACRALGEIGDPRAAKLLIERLEDGSNTVRRAAADALGKTGSPEAVEPLIHALADQNPGVQITAVEALGVLGDARAAGPLCKALDQGYFKDDAYLAVLKTLGQIGDSQAAPQLIRALSVKMAEVQRTAAAALVSIPDPAAVEALVPLLNYENATAIAAGEALLKIGSPAIPALVRALDIHSWPLRRRIAVLLHRLGWQPDDRFPFLRYYLAKDWNGLATLGEEAVEALRTALAHTKSYSMQCELVQAIGRTHAASAVPYLLHLLHSAEHALSGQAALALAELGEPAVEPLVTESQNQNLSSWQCQTLHDILRKIGDPRATPVFVKGLENPFHSERMRAVIALADCGDALAINPLHAAILNEHVALEDEYHSRSVSTLFLK
ncbi:MAG: HEAT repeat domain-containing protein, partial [Thermoleophilia bacterium]|nr:HEAT repeat domain-containing protein [Thermoleophilia bacterium]